ncbi:MAG: Ig-like domain repeat protein [Acidobacteriaceae bacterium]
MGTETTIYTGGYDIYGVAVDQSGNVYVSDNSNGLILKESLQSGGGYVPSTIASGVTYPYGITVDSKGSIYVADDGDGRLLKYQTSAYNFGPVVMASTAGGQAFTTGGVLTFTFDAGGQIGSVQALTQGTANLDFGYHANTASNGCESGHTYSAGDICTVLETFAPKETGPRDGGASLTDTSGNVIATGYAYGSGSGAQVTFSPPAQTTLFSGLSAAKGMAVDASGNLYIVEESGQLLKETSSGGTYTQITIASGLGTLAGGVAVDGAGNVYVTNYGSGEVLKFSLQPGGTYTQSTMASGITFAWGIAVDGSGNVYVVDNNHGNLLKETLQVGGSYIQSTIATGLNQPLDAAVDWSGNVYVVGEAGGGSVLKETPQSNGTYKQSVVASNLPSFGVTVDGNGNVYADSGGSVFKEKLQSNGSYIQSTFVSGLATPYGLVFDGSGNLYIANGTDVVKEDYADPPSLTFASTPVGQTSADSPQTFTVNNIGNVALTFPSSAGAANPYWTGSDGFTLDNSTTCPQLTTTSSSATLAADTSCAYAVDFKPISAGPKASDLLLFDSSLSAPGYAIKQDIHVSGTGTGVSITLSPGGTVPAGTVGIAYDQTISASGGVGSYTFAVTSGSLPAGLTLSSAGVVSGTPTAAGGYNFTVTATDSSTPTAFTGTQSYTLTVNKAAVTVGGTVPTLAYGQSGSATLTVTGAPGVTATGTINYAIDGGTVKTATLSNGSATVPIPGTLASGAHTMTLAYSGDANYLAATGTMPFTIGATIPVIAWATPSSIAYGTALSATQLDATASYNGAVVSGTFTYSPATDSVLSAGTHTLSVSFTPTDSTDYAKATATVSLTVTQAQLTVTATNSTRTYGTANPTFTGAMTGAINGDSFTESFSTTATQSSNAGTYPIVPTAAGTDLSDYTVQATNGTLTVTQAASTIALSASSSSIAAGQTLTLTVQTKSATTGAPTGTVSFYDGTTLLGTSTLSNGSATYATTSLAPNVAHSLTATYAGDVNFTASTSSPAISVSVVAALDFTLTLQGASSHTVIPGESVVYNLQVSPVYTIYPAVVTFSAAGLPQGATASFSPSTVAADGGTQNVTMTVQTASPTTAENLLIPGTSLTLAFLLLPLLGVRKVRRRWMPLLIAVIALTGITALSGCGTANGFNGQEVENYTVAVTATSGTVQHSIDVNLNLQ